MCMSVRVYVCMHVWMYVINVYDGCTVSWMHVCVYRCIVARVFVRMCGCVYVYVRVCMYIRMYACMYVYVSMYVRMCIRVHVCMYVCMYVCM